MRSKTAVVAILVLLASCSSESEPKATFTGDGCDYEGPSEFALDSTTTFTFVNDSEVTDLGFSVWPLPDGANAGEILEKGLFGVIGDDGSLEFYDALFPPTAIGSTAQLDITLDRPGPHAIICFDVSGVGSDRDYAILFDVN